MLCIPQPGLRIRILNKATFASPVVNSSDGILKKPSTRTLHECQYFCFAVVNTISIFATGHVFSPTEARVLVPFPRSMRQGVVVVIIAAALRLFSNGLAVGATITSVRPYVFGPLELKLAVSGLTANHGCSADLNTNTIMVFENEL